MRSYEHKHKVEFDPGVHNSGNCSNQHLADGFARVDIVASPHVVNQEFVYPLDPVPFEVIEVVQNRVEVVAFKFQSHGIVDL